MLSDIGAALDFAHARGTIHRDVKPANILLDPDGTSYLGDFGLVRLDDMPGLTRRGDWLGTAEYVSPEQVEGEQATGASDVYGLAAVAFEALTGRAPFVRREASAVLLAHVREPVPDASEIRPGLPVAVDATLARGLAKDPADRFANANSFVGRPAPRPRLRRAAADGGRRARRRGRPVGRRDGPLRRDGRQRRRASASPRRSATRSSAPAGSAGAVRRRSPPRSPGCWCCSAPAGAAGRSGTRARTRRAPSSAATPPARPRAPGGQGAGPHDRLQGRQEGGPRPGEEGRRRGGQEGGHRAGQGGRLQLRATPMGARRR